MTGSDTRCHEGPTIYGPVEVCTSRRNEEELIGHLQFTYAIKTFGCQAEVPEDNDEDGAEYRSIVWKWKEVDACEVGVQCASPRMERRAQYTSWNRKPNGFASEVRAWMSIRTWDSDKAQNTRSSLLRHGSLANTMLLTAAQLACIVPLQSYNPCHAKSPHEANHELLACASVHIDHLPYYGLLEYTSTPLFVFSALACGALAMYEYQINRQNRYQQAFLVAGLLVGLLACWDAQRLDASRLALSITISLLASACGHWVYGMCFGSRTEMHGAENSEKEVDVEIV